MTLPTVLLLIVIAVGLALRKWHKSSQALGLLAVLLLLGLGCGPAANWLVESLQAGYPTQPEGQWGRRSAIVVLGAGTERLPGSNAVEAAEFGYARLLKALELYLACKRGEGSCMLLLSGGDARNNGVSEAAVYGLQLNRLGINPADLVFEDHSMNTWQNAQFSAALLSARRVDRVYLVSSAIHLRRSELYFAHFGIRATAIRCDYVRAIASPVPLAYNLLLSDLAIHEYVGVLRYNVYQLFGWNAAAERSGGS
jgi:uncharacterized SAM-binding protein YcdF (DUF218 family)